MKMLLLIRRWIVWLQTRDEPPVELDTASNHDALEESRSAREAFIARCQDHASMTAAAHEHRAHLPKL